MKIFKILQLNYCHHFLLKNVSRAVVSLLLFSYSLPNTVWAIHIFSENLVQKNKNKWMM